MDTTVCLACVLVSAICLAFILSIGLLSFYFFEVSKIRQWFERVFSKTRSNLESLKCQEETKNSL